MVILVEGTVRAYGGRDDSQPRAALGLGDSGQRGRLLHAGPQHDGGATCALERIGLNS
jgi:hypothetical protein